MNERIEKLWDEAADSIAAIPNGRNNFWETQENFMEKFAELIVRECANAFETEVDTWKEMSPYQGSIKRQGTKAIKQHFGVEQ